MKKTSRRAMLGAIGLATGAALAPGCGGTARSQAAELQKAPEWRYVALSPAAIAAEALALAPKVWERYTANAQAVL